MLALTVDVNNFDDALGMIKAQAGASAEEDGSEAGSESSTGKGDAKKPGPPGTLKKYKKKDLPEKIDWRDKGAV